MTSELFKEVLRKKPSKIKLFLSRVRILQEIPNCGGYSFWTDWGYEYDCRYDFAGDICCEDCICNKNLGGKIDPRTGEKFSYFKRIR
jgi:hypothetical protein